MGRTNPTYRDYLRQYEQRWQPFRRALRRQYKKDFDRLFERAQQHADAAGYMNAADPHVVALFSMLLAQEVELRQLRGELRQLHDDVPDQDAE